MSETEAAAEPRRIALVGTAESGKHAPYSDERYEIWGVSGRANYVTRATRWFELHRLAGEPPDWAQTWRDTIRRWSSDVEVWMMYPEPDLGPRVVAYPHERITRRFGTFFLTSTFAWKMALAIDEMAPPGQMAPGGTEIAIFGVDMEYGTEYRHQRSGFRHFIDIARILGIKVTRLATGGLAYEPIPYPMWQDDPLLQKNSLRARQAKENITTLEDSLRNTHLMMASTNGAIAEVRLAQSDENYDPEARLRDLSKQHKDLNETSANLSKDLVKNEAVLEERMWLADYLSP